MMGEIEVGGVDIYAKICIFEGKPLADVGLIRKMNLNEENRKR